MRVLYGDKFFRSAKQLPQDRKKKLDRLIVLLSEDPFHPLLHSNPLTGSLSGFYSFRISRDYRVIFKFLSSEEVQLVEVGHRKEIYR